MTIAFGNDHAGYRLRPDIIEILEKLEVEVLDHGSDSPEPVDFPVISRKVCGTVLSGKAERGILLCGSGIGAAMASNKYKGVRAGVCHDTYSAHQGVEHDDMNILCIGAKIIGPWLMSDIIRAFLEAEFDGAEDTARRCGMMNELGTVLEI